MEHSYFQINKIIAEGLIKTLIYVMFHEFVQ